MNNIRKQQLLKIAKALGIVSSVVQDALKPNNKNDLETMGMAGSGASILGGKNLIKDDGTLPITINFRGIAAHPKYYKHLPMDKGILIAANAVPKNDQEKKENLGSALLRRQYSVSRVQSMIAAAVDKAKKAQPNKKINKIILNFMGFSGGGSVVTNMVSAINANPNVFSAEGIPVEVGMVAVNDGWHNKDKSMIDFAKKAKENPDKHRFYITHTAVQTQGYPSSTEVANYLLDQLGMKRQEYKGDPIAGLKPTHIARDGGVTVLTTHDKVAKYDIQNSPYSMGDQHVQAARIGYIPMFEDLNKLIS